MFTAILGTLICTIFIYIYLKLRYFTLRGKIPGLAPEFLFGNSRQVGLMQEKTIPEIQIWLKEKFGDIFRYWTGPTQTICVCNADDVRHIFQNRHIYEQGDIHLKKFSLVFHDSMICNIGAKYKRHTAVVLPLFRRERILKNFNIIIDFTDRLLLDPWRTFEKDHIHQDVLDQTQNLLLRLISYIAFDFDSESQYERDINPALKDFVAIFTKTLFMPSMIAQFYLKYSNRYQQCLSTIHTYLNRIIDQEVDESQHTTQQRKRISLIGSLVHSLEKNSEKESKKTEAEKEGLSRNEIIQEMLLFLFAGFETTATALCWFIHLVSKNPRVQKQLKDELSVTRFTPENIDSLPYLNAVVSEVLRFAPPSIGTVRTLTMNDRLPSCGAQLYKGEQVTVSFYNLARDPRYWKVDPNSFYPERFLNEDEDKSHHPYALVPFGGGHRKCKGELLALFELKVIIARLMQHVTIVDSGDSLNAGQFKQNFTIVPKHVAVKILFD